MLRSFLAIAVGLALASVSHASVFTTFSSSQTVGLAGYHTWIIRAFAVDFSQIVGFDFASKSDYGFFGDFNQVNPFGLPTIFQDNNAAVRAVSDVSQDTQFLFNTSGIVVPPGFASESNTSLRAKFTSYTTFGTIDVPFVQLVVPDLVTFAAFRFRGTVTVARDGNFYDELVEWPTPEPATGAVVAMACAGLAGMRRRRVPRTMHVSVLPGPFSP